MKINKSIICLIMSTSLAFVSVGCNINEVENQPVETVVINNEDVDKEKLREEYNEISDTINYVLETTNNENPSLEIMDLVKHISNRKEPTQKLTIELNDLVTEFVSVGFDYYTTSNSSKKMELEQELIRIFQEIEEKMLEIELILNEEVL